MKTFLAIFILLTTLFLSVNGKKATNEQKKNLKMFNKLAKKAAKYESSLTGLMTRLEAANKTASVSTR